MSVTHVEVFNRDNLRIITMDQKAVAVVHTCNCNTQQVEAGGSRVQGHLQLCNELKASLGYLRYLKKKKTPKPKQKNNYYLLESNSMLMLKQKILCEIVPHTPAKLIQSLLNKKWWSNPGANVDPHKGTRKAPVTLGFPSALCVFQIEKKSCTENRKLSSMWQP